MRFIPKIQTKVKKPAKKKKKPKNMKDKLRVDLQKDMFMKYNKIESFRYDNYDSVDGTYNQFYEFCGRNIDEYVETMPFNRVEIYDFYTKFKALSKLCVDNMRNRRVKREIYNRKKRQVDFVERMSKTNGSFNKSSRRSSNEFEDHRVFTPKL